MYSVHTVHTSFDSLRCSNPYSTLLKYGLTMALPGFSVCSTVEFLFFCGCEDLCSVAIDLWLLFVLSLGLMGFLGLWSFRFCLAFLPFIGSLGLGIMSPGLAFFVLCISIYYYGPGGQ